MGWPVKPVVRPVPAEVTDTRLLATIAEGDLSALGPLFDRHGADVLRFVRRVASADVAEDVTQDVFLRVVRTAARHDGRTGSARSWLFGIAYAIVRERRRATARFLRAITNLGRASTVTSTSPDGGLRADVERALATLNDDKREVIVLVDVFGLTSPEVAEVLGIPVGTVWTRLHHARKALRVALGGDDVG